MIDSNADFEHTFKTQFPVLCNVAFNIIKNQSASESIVQDVFLKLRKNRDKIENIDNYKAYLYRCTTYACIDYLKHSKPKLSLGSQSGAAASSGSGQALSEIELQQHIEDALNLLSPKCRAIFVLSRHEGLKYREIAEYLEISTKTVESLMGIALSKMRAVLSDIVTKDHITPVGRRAEG